jgi:hypothetical protein
MKPHKDILVNQERSNGYAIRLSKNLPKNAVNLAYLSSKNISPSENIEIEEHFVRIPENKLPSGYSESMKVSAKNNYVLETETGRDLFPLANLEMTDEFTISSSRKVSPLPLFYEMKINGIVHLGNELVVPYQNGLSEYVREDAKLFEEWPRSETNELVALGDIVKIECVPQGLSPQDAYKVKMVRLESEDNPFLYQPVVYTNFQNMNGKTYTVYYWSYDVQTKKKTLKKEILNNRSFFEEVTEDEFQAYLHGIEDNPSAHHERIFCREIMGESFRVKASANTIIADYGSRPPHEFRHRIEAKLKTNINESNPATCKMGIIYAPGSHPNLENYSTIGKNLYYSDFRPGYLELMNPHSSIEYLKSDFRYWLIPQNLAPHLYASYDLIIITGYGSLDLTPQKEYLQRYLKQGGTVWLDNGGNAEGTLTTIVRGQNTFVSDIRFDTTVSEVGLPTANNHLYFKRLYPTQNQRIGTDVINNKILFSHTEDFSNWEVLTKYSNDSASMMKRSFEEKGTIIVTNNAFFRSIYNGNNSSLQTFFNIALSLSEHKWVMSPWFNEYVHHKDNLFLSEYTSQNGRTVYVDERNDYNLSQIVAKKQLADSCKEALRPYIRNPFLISSGEYHHRIESEKELSLENARFEVGSLLPDGSAATEWTESKVEAIPFWNTRIIAGSDVTFTHANEASIRGSRYVSVSHPTSAQSFWESKNLITFVPDHYAISVFVKCLDVAGTNTSGIKLALYDAGDNLVYASQSVAGTRDWEQLTLTFSVATKKDLRIRLGFVDGNGVGEFSFDDVQLFINGAVLGTPVNDGNTPLYAFATTAKPMSLEIGTNGFRNSIITMSSPDLPFTYTVRSFIYKWASWGIDPVTGMEYGRYERIYGNSVSRSATVNSNDGILNLGRLHQLLPSLIGGKDWYDRHQVYYEIVASGPQEFSEKLVKLSLFDLETGYEWYQNDGSIIIGYKDIFYLKENPPFVLHAQTSYETIRASRRQFAIRLLEDHRIEAKLPMTQDPRENWHLRISNGFFQKSKPSYEEWKDLYTENDIGTIERLKSQMWEQKEYRIPEYQNQIFAPSIGFATIENQVTYLTPKSLQLPNKNLDVQRGRNEKERLTIEGTYASYNQMPHGYDSFEGYTNGTVIGRATTSDTTVAISTNRSLDGYKSARVMGVNTVKTVAFDQKPGGSAEGILVRSDCTYVFSAYVYTQQNGGTVVAGLSFSDGTVAQSEPLAIPSGHWTRVEISLDAPDTATTVYPFVTVNNNTDIYLDCLQFEEIF